MNLNICLYYETNRKTLDKTTGDKQTVFIFHTQYYTDLRNLV